MDKLLDFQPVNLGLIHASMHVSRWWNQEAWNSPVHQKSLSLYVAMSRLCNEGMHNVKAFIRVWLP